MVYSLFILFVSSIIASYLAFSNAIKHVLIPTASMDNIGVEKHSGLAYQVICSIIFFQIVQWKCSPSFSGLCINFNRNHHSIAEIDYTFHSLSTTLLNCLEILYTSYS